MTSLIIFLVGLLIMVGDPKVPEIVRTITWVVLIIAGIVMGALGAFRI